MDDLKEKFCINPIKNEIIPVVSRLLNLSSSEILHYYSSFQENYYENRFSINKDKNALNQNFIYIVNEQKLGIDLPIWYYTKNAKKILIIAQNPHRKDDNEGLIIGTPFGVGSLEGRTTKKQNYWSFLYPLLTNNTVYITDVFKIFFEETLDNKETTRKFYNDDLHLKILKEEIENVVKPDIIITLGKKAKEAIVFIQNILNIELKKNIKQECCLRKDNIEYYFIPHISTNVTQNIIPIAELFLGIGKLKHNDSLIKTGISIFDNMPQLFNKNQ